MELDVCQSLCQAICDHLIGWDVGKLDPFGSHLIADIMVLNVDVFCSRMENRIVGQGYGALVVSFQWQGDA